MSCINGACQVASRQELEQLSTDEKLVRLEKSLDETFNSLMALKDRLEEK